MTHMCVNIPRGCLIAHLLRVWLTGHPTLQHAHTLCTHACALTRTRILFETQLAVCACLAAPWRPQIFADPNDVHPQAHRSPAPRGWTPVVLLKWYSLGLPWVWSRPFSYFPSQSVTITKWKATAIIHVPSRVWAPVPLSGIYLFAIVSAPKSVRVGKDGQMKDIEWPGHRALSWLFTLLHLVHVFEPLSPPRRQTIRLEHGAANGVSAYGIVWLRERQSLATSLVHVSQKQLQRNLD